MKLYVFSVRDGAVNALLQPFFARSKGEAIRSFTELANDKSSNVSKYPTDFALFELGQYDDNSGLFECHLPKRVITALEVMVVDDVFPPSAEVPRKTSA